MPSSVWWEWQILQYIIWLNHFQSQEFDSVYNKRIGDRLLAEAVKSKVLTFRENFGEAEYMEYLRTLADITFRGLNKLNHQD